MAERITLAEIVALRRSLTVGLPPREIHRLLDTVEELLRERAALETAMVDLGAPWADVKTTLNRMHGIFANGLE